MAGMYVSGDSVRRHDLVVSSDPGDLEAISDATGQRVEVDRP